MDELPESDSGEDNFPYISPTEKWYQEKINKLLNKLNEKDKIIEDLYKKIIELTSPKSEYGTNIFSKNHEESEKNKVLKIIGRSKDRAEILKYLLEVENATKDDIYENVNWTKKPWRDPSFSHFMHKIAGDIIEKNGAYFSIKRDKRKIVAEVLRDILS